VTHFRTANGCWEHEVDARWDAMTVLALGLKRLPTTAEIRDSVVPCDCDEYEREAS
jgi:hypothetical protein